MMKTTCNFCHNPILPNEQGIELKVGIAHEKCYLKRRLESFEESFAEIEQFPKKKEILIQSCDRFTHLIESAIASGLNNIEHKEFCNEWAETNRIIMNFDLTCWHSRNYLAQKSAIDHFLSWVKGYPFVAPRASLENTKNYRLMTKILSAATNYVNALIPKPIRLHNNKEKPATEYAEELKKLALEFDKTTTKMLRNSEKILKKFNKELRNDRKIWLKENSLKLYKYGLI